MMVRPLAHRYDCGTHSRRGLSLSPQGLEALRRKDVHERAHYFRLMTFGCLVVWALVAYGIYSVL